MPGGIGGPELLLVFLVVLLVFGPKKIPEVARGIGKGLRELRRLTTDLQREINLAGDEPEPSRRPARPREPEPVVPPRQAESPAPGAPETAPPPVEPAAPETPATLEPGDDPAADPAYASPPASEAVSEPEPAAEPQSEDPPAASSPEKQDGQAAG